MTIVRVGQAVNKLLGIFGLRIARAIGPVVLHDDFHPKELRYRYGSSLGLIKVPFTNGRTIRGFKYDEETEDPYLAAVLKASRAETEDEFLAIFCEEIKWEKAQDAAKSISLSGDSVLSEFPSWARVFPWDSMTPHQKYKTYPRELIKNRKKRGLKIKENKPDSIMETAFSSAGKLQQAKQFSDLFFSIKKKGYMNTQPYPVVDLLLSGNDWTWKMGREGNHRVTVLNALGYSYFTASVTSIVDIEDLDYWPNVRNGNFNKEQALDVFKRYFNGDGVFVDPI